ncbi:MAG: hypothetical protein ACKO38_20650, partial [Planctomycetota bacterium]
MSSPDLPSPDSTSPDSLSPDGVLPDGPNRETADLTPRVSERLLMEATAEILAAGPIVSIFCGSLGRGQLAKALAAAAPTADVAANFFDLHQMRMAQLGVVGDRPRFLCEPDDPAAEGSLDCVALPLAASGDAELTLDRLQAAHVALRVGGRLWAATDNPRDRWTIQVKIVEELSAMAQVGPDLGLIIATGVHKETVNMKDDPNVQSSGA